MSDIRKIEPNACECKHHVSPSNHSEILSNIANTERPRYDHRMTELTIPENIKTESPDDTLIVLMPGFQEKHLHCVPEGLKETADRLSVVFVNTRKKK